MQVTVICRKNQARSIFAEYVISSQFPEIEVKSAGTHVELVDLPALQVSIIASEWGVNCEVTTPRSISDMREYIESSDLVILAEQNLVSELTKFKVTGKVRSLEEYSLDTSFSPKDPAGFSNQKLREELGKMTSVALRAIESELHISSTFGIKVVVPTNPSDCELAFTHAQFERQQNNGFLVDIDFRSPYSIEFAGLAEFEFYDPLETDLTKESNIFRSKILSPIREVKNPESVLISREFRIKIRKLADIAPVTLVTAPRNILGQGIPDSYLAAVLGNQISTINC